MEQYGSPDPLKLEPGTPRPARPPRRAVEFITAAAASVGTSAVGVAVATLLINHDALGYAVIVAAFALGASVAIMGREDSDGPTIQSRSDHDQVYDLLLSGVIDVDQAERLLAVTATPKDPS
jgi:hypothetical protein